MYQLSVNMFADIFKISLLIKFLLFVRYIETLTFLKKHQLDVNLQVTTSNGIVQGSDRKTIKKNGFLSFEGIPFAEPPLDDLRFRSPKPIGQWNAVLDATRQKEGCIQMDLRTTGIRLYGSEDCLHLNVYTPKKSNESLSSSLLPVLFWIHGGAFQEGDAAEYGPHHLVDQNIIVVTFNYRLGLFGFLSTTDEALPGNYGLKDQLLALKWVNTNIHLFGGDPKKITIAGQSAGSTCVMYLLVSPKSRGLFQRAIAMSGETTSPWAYQKYPKRIAMNLAAHLRINTKNTTKIVERLRKVDIESLKTAEARVIVISLLYAVFEGLPFTPTIEPDHPDAFLTKNAFDCLRRGDFNRVPIIFGTTNEEVGFFGKLIQLIKPIFTIFDLSPSMLFNGLNSLPFKQRRQIGIKIAKEYFSNSSFTLATYEELLEYLADVLFIKPITNTVRTVANYTEVYYYVFADGMKGSKLLLEAIGYFIDTTLKGTVHAEDIPLLFTYLKFSTPWNSYNIQRKFIRLIKNFMLTGNPTPIQDSNLDNVIWPMVKPHEKIPYLLLRENLTISYDFRKEKIDFWDAVQNEFYQNV